jgi:hypothetical protein
VIDKILLIWIKQKQLHITHGIRFAPSGLGLHKPPVRRALGAGTPFVAVCSATFCKPCKHSVFARSSLQNVLNPFELGKIAYLFLIFKLKYIFMIKWHQKTYFKEKIKEKKLFFLKFLLTIA